MLPFTENILSFWISVVGSVSWSFYFVIVLSVSFDDVALLHLYLFKVQIHLTKELLLFFFTTWSCFLRIYQWRRILFENRKNSGDLIVVPIQKLSTCLGLGCYSTHFYLIKKLLVYVEKRLNNLKDWFHYVT